VNRFIVRQPTEEGQCVQCGFPVYVCDWAIESNGSIYCSEGCLREDRSHNDGPLPVFSRDEDYPD
jgi:hypothetical protein